MMELDIASPLPLYHQLQQILRSQLADRAWKVGEQLPSEHELCRRHGVTRPTVRQALEGLVREGLVCKRRGKGAYVNEPPRPVGIFSLTGTSDALTAQTLKVETRVLRIEIIPFCEFAEASAPSGGWLKLERVRQVNKKPAFFEHTWLRATLVPKMDRINLNNQSLFHTLFNKYRLRVNGGRQRFSAVKASRSLAEALKVQRGAPLLRVLRSIDLNRCSTTGFVLERFKAALQVDLYATQGPFVLEQDIPAGMSDEADVSVGLGRAKSPSAQHP